MTDVWTDRWLSLEFAVELREIEREGGPTLRVRSATDGDQTEWLRFDCFDRDPHWHLDPAGGDEIHPLVDVGDPIAEALGKIESDLPQLLERAGIAPDIASDLRAAIADPKQETARRDTLRAAESAMRHRPIDFDELDIRELQQRRSAKWKFHPRDVLPAWVAEMDYPIAAPIQAELRRLTELGDVGYPLGNEESGLPEAFRERMNDRFGWNPDPGRVELLSEVVQGMYIALEAFTKKGDGRNRTDPDLSALSRRRRGNRTAPHRESARLEREPTRIRPRRAVEKKSMPTRESSCFGNPHNPSGRVMLRDELETLGRLVLEHDLVVVSDEIHADLLYDRRKHIPFATLGPEIAKRTVTLTSASKAFNIPGLRCAVAHFGSADLQERFNRLHPPHTRGGIGLFGIYASIAAWRWGQPWLDDVVTHLEGNRDYLKQALEERIRKSDSIRLKPPTWRGWIAEGWD